MTTKFLGATVNLDTQSQALLTIGTSLIGNLLEACTTGHLRGLGQTADIGADLVEQAIRHPQTYNPPKP